jgi:tRNA1(Val) A37 N6-methylase TrmN6
VKGTPQGFYTVYMTQAPEIRVLDHKVRLLQAKDGFRTSLDSVLLAAACKARSGEHLLDMGCGVGSASFCVLWRVENSRVTGVEIQSDDAEIAKKNTALNGMEGRAEFINADIRHFRAEKTFDHVICNPPYLEAGTYTPSPLEKKAKALGHQETDVSLKDWLDAGFHNVKSGGSLTIIHRADMVDKIITGLGKRFGAIEIIPLWPHAGENAKRVIVRAIKHRRTPACLNAGIVLHEDHDNSYTAQANAILRDGKAIE